eukprot:TRINITY_DN2746_c0_g2_i1.p1 TRINITY_DN2746_c0_g2~~TRINITY_DN2746_c0_g2_i1.p1  ORF type:complete len:460 (-),score=65.44 TRINITY_DN2746_c0_g2_i1:52-1431(-)
MVPKKVDISNQKLKNIPQFVIQSAKRIKELNASNNSLKFVDDDLLYNLNVLETINLENNKLQEFPDYLSCLPRMRNIYLQNNKITSLSNNLEVMDKLYFLDLSGNRLRNFSDSVLIAIQEVRILLLRNNRISKLPTVFGLFFRNLKILDISKMGLKHLPKSLLNLSKLDTLNLSDNKLKTFPVEVEYMHSLRILYIENNRINIIPKEISGTQSLQELHARENQIQRIEANGLTNCINLKVLYLSNNKLHEVPEDITDLKNLQEVDFSKNPFKNKFRVLNDIVGVMQLFEVIVSIYNPTLLSPLDFSDKSELPADHISRNRCVTARFGTSKQLLMHMLEEKSGFDSLYEFCRRERSEENLDFYREANDWKAHDLSPRGANAINKRYINHGSPLQINISGTNRKDILHLAEAGEYPESLYDNAIRETIVTLLQDTFRRFKTSDMFARYKDDCLDDSAAQSY